MVPLRKISYLVAIVAVTSAAYAQTPVQPIASGNAETILVEFINAPLGHTSPGWYEERVAAIRTDPALFAPLIRDRLVSGVPVALDEYSLDDPRWVMNRPSSNVPSAPIRGIMRAVALLPPEHADPILQEFFDRVNRLALEADRRRWQAEDAYRANVAGADEMMRKAGEYGPLRAARGMAVDTAQRLDSSILYDDFVAMLASDDPVAQETGANYTRGNLDKIMERHPDALAQVVEAAARLSVSENPRVAKAGGALVASLRDALPGAQGDAAPPGEPRPEPPR